jgi:DNA-binding MarR family transcriptional regulator
MESDTDIAHDVLRSIRQIVRRISAHSKALSRDVGLTVPQLVCLKAIGELEQAQGEITAAMVGKRVQLSAATVSRILDRLVRNGLVVRERRAKDRRKVCLSLTEAGLERFGTLPIPLQERFVERLMRLRPDERVELLTALRRITALMDAEELEAAPLLTPGDTVKAYPDEPD